MGAQLQKIATFLIGGANTLGGWIVSLVTGAHSTIDQCITLHHGIWAWAILIMIGLVCVGIVRCIGWKRVPKPKKPEEMILVPRNYSLLLLFGVIVTIYLAACFVAMD
ncbi:MAG: hypothetical protein LUG58_08515 [Clostridiales bacterium]|nr:hypothetical protein [Clostridiales bacterium]